MADSVTDSVTVQRHGPVLVITLDRPAKRNAMDGVMARALAAAADELDADPDLAVGILTGAGGTFCSGMDLAAFETGDVPEVPGRGLGGITRTPPEKPLIAAVEGYALAGGCELALACDLIVAAENATFGLPEVRRGLIAGSGGLLRLPQRIPPAVALRHALTGDPLPATDAARWGLVATLTPPGETVTEALRLAERMYRNGPLAVRATKHIMRAAPTWPAEEVWDRQQELLGEILTTADAQEGARAFAEHREPRWRGR